MTIKDDPANDPEEKPFASPEQNITATESRDIRLFSLAQIGWATFFGNWIAGSILVAANYSQLGRKYLRLLALLFGLGGLFAYLGFSYYFGRPSRRLVNIAMTLLFIFLAYLAQGKAIKHHMASPMALRRSNWLVFLAILIGLLPIIVIIVSVAWSGHTRT